MPKLSIHKCLSSLRPEQQQGLDFGRVHDIHGSRGFCGLFWVKYFVKSKTSSPNQELLLRNINSFTTSSLGEIQNPGLTLESPVQSKDIKPVNLKGNQPWTPFGRADAEAEAPVLWPPDVNSLLFGKGPDTGKDWRQKKRVTEDEMVGWHLRFKGHELG